MHRISVISAAVAAAAMSLAALVALTVASAVITVSTVNLYVNPVQGSAKAAGTQAAPLRTIQQAMDRARPGTVIHLAAGTYSENVVTRVDGLPGARIVVEGPASGQATLFGTSHVVAIKNSYYTLRGFAIDGQEQVENRYRPSAWPTQMLQIGEFKASVASLVSNDRLIYIDSGSALTGVTGTIIDRMTLTGAGGECIRIRDDSTNNIVENSTIRYCGMYPQDTAGIFTYHNGEGVYIGTSPKSIMLPGYQDDQSSGNLVTGDTITTYASECFDVKENSYRNVLSDSRCADNTEPVQDQGSNVELRGYANTVENDQLSTSAGYGLKIIADSAAEDLGRNNVMTNTFSGQPAGALYDKSGAPPGRACGNVVAPGSNPGDFTDHSIWLSPCASARPA
jgi:Protein of unknown function (DUF1565)